MEIATEAALQDALKDLLRKVVQTLETKERDAGSLCKLVSVMGRFGSIDVAMFLKCVRQFEEACILDAESNKKRVTLLHLNVFLDGIKHSGLVHGNVIVKKVLEHECPGIRSKILNISNPPTSQNEEDSKRQFLSSSDFVNNYASLLRLMGHLQFVPLSFFEDQLEFIWENEEFFFTYMRQEALSTILRLIIKLNLKSEHGG